MAFTNYRILIYSENPDKLVEFYKEVLGFRQVKKLNIPKDYGYILNVTGDLNIWIGRHSKIKGKVTEHFRHLFNFYSEEAVGVWYEKLKSNPKVTIIAAPFLAPYSTPENEVWFCTFLDPEGNCLQIVGKK